MEQHYKNSYKVTQKELVSLSVYNVGCQKCDSLYQWGPGIRDHYLIHYIISGTGCYITGGQTHHLGPGDCFLVYPNTEVTYCADADTPWEYAWVGFTGSDAAMILQATDFSKQVPYLRATPYGEEIKRQLLHIYDARGNEFEHAVEMTGRLYTTLALFMHGAQRTAPPNTAATYVQKGIEYISSNYSYPITVEDIAAYVGLSRSHLFRSFETVLGLSPKEYLTDFRIKQSCYLLEHSDLSVTAIANSIGFDNSLYFSKTFHKKKEMSPKEYRKEHKKSPD
jgi:AraC-like DNA-binding protein